LALSGISNLFVGVGLLAGVNVGGIPLSYPGPGIASLIIAGVEAWMIWYLLRPDVERVFAPPPPPPPPRPTVEPVRPRRDPTLQIGVGPGPEAWLVLRSGSRSGRNFGLRRGRNIVGRDPSEADIVLEDDTVSNEHASIRFERGQFYVTDLDSTNGTRVNNQLVQKQMLMDGDVLHFGDAKMVFKRVD
jgi:hypothetical protein